MPYSPTITDSADATEVREHLRGAGEYLLGLQRTTAEQRGDTFSDDVRSAVDFIHTWDALLTAVERSTAPPEPEARGPQAAWTPVGADEFRSVGNLLTDSDEYRTWAAGGSRNGSNPYEWRMPETRTLLTSSTSDPAAGIWRPVGTPFLNAVRQRRMFVRDLLSVQQTSLSSVPYIRELNPTTNETGASAVSEGSAKPEATMQFVQADAPVRKIAAWIPVTEEILMDAPTLRGYIDNRLAYMLAIREEQQVLTGSGTAPQLEGVMTVSGKQTQAIVAGDLPATVGQAIGKVENVDGAADGVVLNPLDYWVATVKRHTDQFDNGFGGNAPAQTSQITWGLPAVRTRALASGDGIVADWAMGATLFDRMQTTIRVGDQHSDYFTKNLLVILAEERVALAIHRPDFFVDCDIPTS